VVEEEAVDHEVVVAADIEVGRRSSSAVLVVFVSHYDDSL
jgi:hypothetical protein